MDGFIDAVLEGHERVSARLVGNFPGAKVRLVLWKPRTTTVDAKGSTSLRAAQSVLPGPVQHLTFTAPGRGWYYVEVSVTAPGYGPYRLRIEKTPTP